jgi:hypothetical protein
MPHRRRKRSGTDTWNRRFDRIHAQGVCSTRPYPTSLRVFIGAARDANILTAEGKTMNGSAEKRQPSIVLHGVGVQAGASACWRRAGRRSRREAAVAAPWRMGPAAGGPTNNFFASRENGIDSSHAHRNGNLRAMFRHAQMTVDAVAIHSRRRVDTDAVRLPACAIQAPELTVLNLIVRLERGGEKRSPPLASPVTARSCPSRRPASPFAASRAIQQTRRRREGGCPPPVDRILAGPPASARCERASSM